MLQFWFTAMVVNTQMWFDLNCVDVETFPLQSACWGTQTLVSSSVLHGLGLVSGQGRLKKTTTKYVSAFLTSSRCANCKILVSTTPSRNTGHLALSIYQMSTSFFSIHTIHTLIQQLTHVHKHSCTVCSALESNVSQLVSLKEGQYLHSSTNTVHIIL